MKITNEAPIAPLDSTQLNPGRVYSRVDREDLGKNNVWLAADAGFVVRLWDGFSIPAKQCAGFRELNAELVIR